ncbi:MAG: TetR/AcrR family transcriptional regulator [Myxococcota bacterium]
MAYRRTDKVQKRLDEKRRSILSAARTHFAAQGYASTTMQQVSKSAGTSIGNLYFYFSNKEELLLAVVDDFILELGERIDTARARSGSAVEQLTNAIYAAILWAMANEQLLALILLGDGAQSLRQRVLDFFTERLIDFLRTHADEIPETDPVLAAHAWEGAVFNVLEQRLAGRLDLSNVEIARFLAHWNLRALGFSEEVATERVQASESWIRTAEPPVFAAFS